MFSLIIDAEAWGVRESTGKGGNVCFSVSIEKTRSGNVNYGN